MKDIGPSLDSDNHRRVVRQHLIFQWKATSVIFFRPLHSLLQNCLFYGIYCYRRTIPSSSRMELWSLEGKENLFLGPKNGLLPTFWLLGLIAFLVVPSLVVLMRKKKANSTTLRWKNYMVSWWWSQCTDIWENMFTVCKSL